LCESDAASRRPRAGRKARKGQCVVGSDGGAGEIRPILSNVSIDLNRNTRVEVGHLGRNASGLGAVARAFQLFDRNDK
jgi:hypothetical protein